MAYIDDILALSPDHVWTFDAGFTDSVGTANGTNTGFVTNTPPLCEGASNSSSSNNVGDRVTIPATTDIEVTYNRKALGGWIRVDSLQLPPKSIYREGTTGNQFNIIMWAGNNLMLDLVAGTVVLQAYSDNVFKPNRTYHVFAKVEGAGFDDEFALYVDGVRQAVTEPKSGQTGVANFGARTPAEFADPSGASEAGNEVVTLNGPEDCAYNYWASFFLDPARLTDQEIREELFEKGALPGVTITSQAELDALAGTLRPDEPLNIRVTGTGPLTLEADNITHDPLASIHVQWTGTGALTWINNNGSNASIGSTPNGGTINFVTPSVITASPLVPGTEVRVYDSGTITELAGVENSGTSFSASVQASSIDVVILKEDYVYIRVNAIDMTSGDVSLPVSQQFDRNYENP